MLYLAILILVVLAVAGLPSWPYAAGWNAGYYPSGFFLLLLIVLIVLLVSGRGF